MEEEDMEIPQTEPEATERIWALVAASKADLSIRARTPSPPPPPLHSLLPQDQDGSTEFATSTDEELIPVDDDPLIPTSAQVRNMYIRSRATWLRLLEDARGYTLDMENPAVMLGSVPALPRRIGGGESGVLGGHCVWTVNGEEDVHTFEERTGCRREVVLEVEDVLRCQLLSKSRDELQPNGKGLKREEGDGWLPVLVMCWSYILSARLLDLQDRKFQYSDIHLEPRVGRQATEAGRGEVCLELWASPRLVRWLCALLAPGLGYLPRDKRGFPPWMTAFGPEDVGLAVVTDGPIAFELDQTAPDFCEAAELLIELCQMFNLTSRPSGGKISVSPCIAAFHAALALPFYRQQQLQPRFHISSLSKLSKVNDGAAKRIDTIVVDLPYYMTLSLCPQSIGSAIWSIFWQPDVVCNLVSPYLSGIISVLQPFMDASDISLLIRVFALRRPRVAPWWHGLVLLGDTSHFLTQMRRYLTTLQESSTISPLSASDTTTSAWIASPHSFLDAETVHIPAAEEIAKEHLLHIRYSYRLCPPASSIPAQKDGRGTETLLLGWRPFGWTNWRCVEPDMLGWMLAGRRTHIRRYQHWVWDGGDVQSGFRQETGRFVDDVRERLELLSEEEAEKTEGKIAEIGWISAVPSRTATRRMLRYCMIETSGDQHWENADIPELQHHPWMEGWRA